MTAGIAEMLMQSDPVGNEGGTVHLLPALPDAWSEGRVSGLKARGGYEVSIVWADGSLKTADVKASADGVLKLRCKDALSANGLKYLGTHDGVYEYEVAVKKGQTVHLTAASNKN